MNILRYVNKIKYSNVIKLDGKKNRDLVKIYKLKTKNCKIRNRGIVMYL